MKVQIQQTCGPWGSFKDELACWENIVGLGRERLAHFLRLHLGIHQYTLQVWIIVCIGLYFPRLCRWSCSFAGVCMSDPRYRAAPFPYWPIKASGRFADPPAHPVGPKNFPWDLSPKVSINEPYWMCPCQKDLRAHPRSRWYYSGGNCLGFISVGLSVQICHQKTQTLCSRTAGTLWASEKTVQSYSSYHMIVCIVG